MTLLLDRQPTQEDLESERDAPRSGVWAGEDGADLRALTQDETDRLIRMELFASALPEEVGDVLAAVGGHVEMPAWPGDGPVRPFRSARVQRGGIDSDPLVRVLARRAWGERDRKWFELRGVRKDAQLVLDDHGRVVELLDAEWLSGAKYAHSIAQRDAMPGELIEVDLSMGSRTPRWRMFQVGDRPRARPGDLAMHLAESEMGRLRER